MPLKTIKQVMDEFDQLDIYCSKSVEVSDGETLGHYETADATADIKSFLTNALSEMGRELVNEVADGKNKCGMAHKALLSKLRDMGVELK